MTTDKDKAALRTQLLARRTAIPRDIHADWSRRAQERILTLDAWRDADEILLYAAFRNETDTALLLQDAWSLGTRVLLPRCRENCPGAMDLAPVCGPTDLAPGRYGILEPCAESCLPPDAWQPGLAVLPGVGFSRNGLRLGYGGGYYDRLLALPNMADCLCIGLAFALQIIDDLPANTWDQPVRAVATEAFLSWT